MPEIKHLFNAGRMNKDLDERLVPNGEYRDALNIQLASTDGNNVGAIQNLKGNEAISSISGPNAVCIGSIADTSTNKIYWFVKDENKDFIAEYDTILNIVKPVIVDTESILNFPSTKITGIVIIEDFLAWTDDTNEPKILDIQNFISYSNNDFNTHTQINSVSFVESDVTIIKQKPLNAPVINFSDYLDGSVEPLLVLDLSSVAIGDDFTVVTNSPDTISNIAVGDAVELSYVDPSTQKYYYAKGSFVSQTLTPNLNLTLNLTYKNNNANTDAVRYVVKKYIEPIFQEKFVRFSYRWKFNDGQYSVMAPFSETAFYPKEISDYNLETGFNNQMVNSITGLFLTGIEYNVNDISEIDILYKETNNTNIYIYKTLPITNFLGNVTIEKENVYSVLPNDQLLRQFDAVPNRALAMDLVANRLVFANYENGIDLTGYSPNFNISLDDRTTNTLRSIKSNRNYEFGILFEDKYGRQTPIVANDFGVKKIDLGDGGKGKAFNVQMTGPQPTDSKIDKFKIYIKESAQQYYNFIVDKAYNDSTTEESLWLSVPSYEINKFNEEDYIILKKGANTNVPLNNKNAKYKVLDIQSSKPDSITATGQFDDRFFVKVQKDSIISAEFLSSSGVAGNSSLIESNDFITVGIPQTGALYLGDICIVLQGDDRGDKYSYWFKDGNVYVFQESCSNSGTNLVGTSIGADVACNGTTLLAADGWEQTNTSLYTDSTGEVTVYTRPVFNGQDIEVFVCYASSSAGTGGGPAVFETAVKDDLLDIYYETEESYPISEYGDPHTLRWFNCFNFGNGIESNRLRDDFNEVIIDNQVRVSTTISEQYKRFKNTSGLIWSGLFNSRNGINRLNQFNTGEAITKDLNPEYGSIQKIHTRDTDLIAFCEDKVLKIKANKDMLYNADGSSNVAVSNLVLSTAVPYLGEFGISKNPESFASYGYQVYFTDKARGAVLRLSRDGLTLISDKGMSTYFRDKFNSHSSTIIGSYDIHTRQYILSLTSNESVAFSEAVDGWTSKLSYVPENGLSLNGQYFTFKYGEIWKHHSNGINNFYNTQYNSSVKFIFNDEPSIVKNFKTLSYEGTQGKNLTTNGWQTTSIETDLQSGKVTYFKGKEGKWFNNIEGISNNLSNIDSKEFSVQGIGDASNVITPFSCSNAGFTVSDGTVGEGIDANISSGSIVNITPSTYQLGTIEYTAEILAPSGYSNSGSTINCTSTAIGIPTFNCTEAEFVVATGTEGETVQATSTSSIVSITPSIYQVGSFTYTGTITVPSGFSNSGSTINCTSTANGIALPEYTCTEASFSVSDGTEGGNVQATAAETIISITPSTYQLGTSIYTAVITIPSGYLNAGSTISCTDTATGSAVIEPDPTFDCSAASFNVSDGTVGDAVSATSSGTIVSISPSTYQLGTTTYVGTITAPAGYSNVGSNISCSDSATGSNGGDPDPTFDCVAASFTVYDGQIGDPINAISSGTIISVSPSTYQTGTVTYTGTITAPAGYANAGSNINCTDSAVGSDTPVPDPAFTCTDANFSVSNGTVGEAVQGTASGTIVSITPSTYQSGTTTYTGVITIPNGFQNAGSTISCTASATGTEVPVTFEYQLESCADGLTTYKSDPTSAVFSVGERVTIGASVFVVLGTNPPVGATSVGWIVYTGFTGCPVVADPTYTCTDANFSVSDGVVGDTVQATSSGSIVSISPSTYQAGAITYTGVITIPAGYDNAGGTINCTDSALGTSAPTCYAVTYDESLYGLDKDVYGIAYNDYQGNLQKVAFNSMLSSVSGTQYTYYVCATNVGNDVWDVVSNVAVPQYNDSLSKVDSGTPCDGFCSPPGGGGL